MIAFFSMVSHDLRTTWYFCSLDCNSKLIDDHSLYETVEASFFCWKKGTKNKWSKTFNLRSCWIFKEYKERVEGIEHSRCRCRSTEVLGYLKSPLVCLFSPCSPSPSSSIKRIVDTLLERGYLRQIWPPLPSISRRFDSSANINRPEKNYKIHKMQMNILP